MDDADLAGPLVFCFVFATLLLVVSATDRAILRVELTMGPVHVVGQAAVLVHLWSRARWFDIHLRAPQPHVGEWYRRVQDRIGAGVLPATPRTPQHAQRDRQPRVSSISCTRLSSLRLDIPLSPHADASTQSLVVHWAMSCQPSPSFGAPTPPPPSSPPSSASPPNDFSSPTPSDCSSPHLRS